MAAANRGPDLLSCRIQWYKTENLLISELKLYVEKKNEGMKGIGIGIQTQGVNLVGCSLYGDMLRALWLSTCSDDLESSVRLWFH